MAEIIQAVYQAYSESKQGYQNVTIIDVIALIKHKSNVNVR